MEGVVGGVCNHPLEVSGQCCVAGEIQTQQARRAQPRPAAGQGRERRAEASAPGPAPGCPRAEPDAPSLESLSPPEYARSGEPSRAAGLSFPRVRKGRGGRTPGEAGTHLSSEVEEQGDAADHLAQPQSQEGHEHGAGGGGGLVRRGRRGRRGDVQGALVRGARAAAAHLLRAAQVLGVVSAGAAHGARPAGCGARLPRSLPPSPLPATTSKDGAEPARGQAGLDVGRSEPGAARGARGRAGRAPRYPNSYKPLARAGLRSQSAPGEAASSTPTSGSPSFLSPPSLSCSL